MKITVRDKDGNILGEAVHPEETVNEDDAWEFLQTTQFCFFFGMTSAAYGSPRYPAE